MAASSSSSPNRASWLELPSTAFAALSREKQIEVIAALCDGLGHRAVSRITGVNRGTVASLALRVGRGCAELHDRMIVGVRTYRLELDELGHLCSVSAAGIKSPVRTAPLPEINTLTLLYPHRRAPSSPTSPASDSGEYGQFIQDLRQRVIGTPEISTDGYHPYRNAIRDAFTNRVAHGVVVKTYSVTHLALNPIASTKVYANAMNGKGSGRTQAGATRYERAVHRAKRHHMLKPR